MKETLKKFLWIPLKKQLLEMCDYIVPFMKLGRLTISPFGKGVHVREDILNLYLGVSYVLLEKVPGVFRLEGMKPIEPSRFVLYTSLELLQTVVGRLHLPVNFLG